MRNPQIQQKSQGRIPNKNSLSRQNSANSNSSLQSPTSQQLSTTNKLSFQQNGVKGLQPVRKSREELKQSTLGLKKSNSGPDVKKQKFGKPMKEKTFNYKEQSTDQNEMPSVSRPFENSKSPQPLDYEVGDGDQLIEANHDQDKQITISQAYRPSDEGQYQEIRMQQDDHGDGLKDSANKNQSNSKGNYSSFNVNEESKTGIFNTNMKPSVAHDSDYNLHFDVIREEQKDLGVSLSQKELNSYDWREGQNSDYKRFPLDDDYQNQESLRIMKGTQNEDKLSNQRAIDDAGSGQAHPFSQIQVEDLSSSKADKQEYRFTLNQTQGESSLDNSQQFFQNQNNSQNRLHNHEHVLSFGEQPIYSNQQPSQQQNETQRSHHQEKRLEDILRSSQTDLSQLQSAISHNQVDEHQLNSMIDMEKNYVIMQYENILQQLNVEFHKLLTKNKDMEEAMAHKEQCVVTQSNIVLDKDEQVYSLEHNNRQLKNQVQEMLQDMELLQQQQQKSTINDEGHVMLDREINDQKLQQLKSQLYMSQQNESDLREQCDSLASRLRHKEQELRGKEEEMFQVSRERQSLQRDLKNLGGVEQQLKQEISLFSGQRLDLEDVIQQNKQMVCSLQIQLRQREMEVESLVRENRSLKGTLDIVQTNYTEVLQEGNQLKESITDSEGQKLVQKSHIQKQGREIISLQADIKRQKVILDQTQMSQSEVVEQLQQENDSFRKQLELQKYHQAQQHQQQYQQPRKSDDAIAQGDYISERSNQNHNSPLKTNSQNPSRGALAKEQARPLQEQHPNQYSPQRNQRPALQEATDPTSSSKAIDLNMKSAFLWPSQTGSVPYQSIDRRADHLSNEKQNQLNEQAYQRRMTQTNQNDSHLQDVFAWPAQKQSTFPQHQLAKSFERDQHSNQKNSQVQQQNTWNVNIPQQQQQATFHHSKANQDQQPAGKKSLTGQSPLEGKPKNVEQHINHMQNSLSMLQMDKERRCLQLENTFRRQGAHPKNKHQIEKNQELEFELDIVTKNIQSLKQKLRERNAL